MALLSGLQTQCEISQLLDELYGDLSLSYPNEREGRKRCYTSQGAAKHLQVVQGEARGDKRVEGPKPLRVLGIAALNGGIGEPAVLPALHIRKGPSEEWLTACLVLSLDARGMRDQLG